MNDGHYQPTSAPYSADNLAPHDAQIVKLKNTTLEFGTETLLTAGDQFTGTFSQPSVNSINARLGMLEVQQLTASATSVGGLAGSSFLLPEWSSYPPTPSFGTQPEDPRAIVMYAHILKREANLDDPFDFGALLVLAGESFVGDVSAEQCTAIGIVGDAPMAMSEPASAIFAEFENGAGNEPSDSEQYAHWGSNLYLRILLIGDDTKETDATFWVGRDGLTWTPVVQSQILADGGPMRRVGLGVIGGTGVAWLDWMRIYSYPFTGETGGLPQPLMPLTGTRRY